MKNLSVVVVSYNTRDILEKSLHALLPQLKANEDELIVVDNASSDGTAEMVRAKFPSAKLIVQDKDYGYAHGSNRGFEASSGEYLLVMSSDIVFPLGTLAAMVGKMRLRPDVGIVCPEFIDFNGALKQLTWQWKVWLGGELLNKLFSPTSIASRGWVRSLLPFLQRNEKEVAWVSGAAFLIRRVVYEKIQGFDEEFQLYYEDTDLCDRTREAGYKILFTPQIKAFHGLGESTKNEKSKIYLIFVQSRLYYYKKHLPAWQFSLLLWFLRRKLGASSAYQKSGGYKKYVDHILNQQETILLWQDIQL